MSAGEAAMVLAAGLGTRMRHLTGDRPKPLVELGGKTLLDHVLDRLAEAKVSRVVVNVHYMADLVEVHLEGRKSPRIVVSDERDSLLDTGGGVARALPKLGNAPFFIHNSDSVWIEGEMPALDTMRASWHDGAMDVLLMLAPREGALGYYGRGDFDMEADGRVRRVAGNPAQFVFTGVSLIHPRLFSGAPEGAFSLNLLWDKAIASGRARGLRHPGQWMHVGTPEAVKEAGERLARERA